MEPSIRVDVSVSADAYVGPEGAGWALVVRDAAGHELLASSGPLPPSPSHLAEWRALGRALDWVATVEGPAEVRLLVGSALVAKGLAASKPAMSGEAVELRAEARRRLARLAARSIRVRVERIAREGNRRADELARSAAGRATG